MQLCIKLCDVADKLPLGSNKILYKGMSTDRGLFHLWYFSLVSERLTLGCEFALCT